METLDHALKRMEKYSRILFQSLALFVLTTSCRYTTERTVVNFEYQHYSCSVTGFISVGAMHPFYAADSLLLLEAEYESFKQQKLEDLDNQRKEVEARIHEITTECRTMPEGAMKRVMLQMAVGTQARADHLQNLYAIYSTQPEKTQLKVYLTRMEAYRQDSQKLLGYMVPVDFIGMEGSLPKANYQKRYLFDTRKKTIIGVLHNEPTAP